MTAEKPVKTQKSTGRGNLPTSRKSNSAIAANRGKIATIKTSAGELDVVDESLLGKTFGSTDADFVGAFLSQSSAQSTGSTEVGIVPVLKGVGPRDQLEAMLIAHMVSIHNTMMKVSRFLADCQDPCLLDALLRHMNNLSRTYTGQLDALKRYRMNASQNVSVESVTVNAGGQAIVGNVSKVKNNERGTSTKRGTDAVEPALRGHNAQRKTMQ
jgi:hypothetical protein